MTSFRPTVTARRVLAAKPWLYWCGISLLTAAIAATVLERIDRIDAARAAWGTTAPVLVADRQTEPGDPITGDVRRWPAAMVPATAVAPAEALGLVAHQRIAPGEVVTTTDVVAAGPLALAPARWLVVPVVESPVSGAAAGDRVQLASDGLVIAPEAVVVGAHDDVTLVAVPGSDAATLAAASAAGGLAVLRVP